MLPIKLSSRDTLDPLPMATKSSPGGRSIAPPANEVLPKGIGPIDVPNANDVLSGRGGRINAHPGNVQFREIISSMKSTYLSPKTKKLEKAHIANEIVRRIRRLNPPGRFLKEEKDGMWWDIGDEKARKKVGQALREDAPDIRPNLPEGSGKGAAGAAEAAQRAVEKAKAATAAAAAAAVAQPVMSSPSNNGSPTTAAPGFGNMPQPGVMRTPSFTSGRGMSPRGSAGGRGNGGGRGAGGYEYPQHHPGAYGYAQDPAQAQWLYPGDSGAGGGVPATQGSSLRNPSEMTFAGKTFHPTESGGTADCSDISELSLNVGSSLMSSAGGGRISPNAAAAAAGGSSGGRDGALQFSHRSQWQHNQLRNRAERYAQQGHANADPNAFPPAQPSPYGQVPSAAHPYPHHPGKPGLQQSLSMGPMGGTPGSRYAQLLHHQQSSSSMLKISDKSDLSMSFAMSGLRGPDAAGRLARSLSIPGLKSGDLMSLGEASFHALLEDEELATYDAQLRKNNPTLGYTGVAMEVGYAAAAAVSPVPAAAGAAAAPQDNGTGNEIGGKPPRDSGSSKHSSAISALSSDGKRSAADASQRSNISMAEVSAGGSAASSWMRNYKGQDVGSVDGNDAPLHPSWMAMDPVADQFSTNSILSEISTDLMALDLADSATMPAMTVPRRA